MTWLFHFSFHCHCPLAMVDVGINRPIKMQMTEQWEKWMFEGGGIVDGVAKEPSLKLVA
jgi:hypothetical protein